MSIWITILLSFLPKILEWLLSLIKSGKQIPANQLRRMNNLTYYAAQIAKAAPKAGCVVGGVPPDVNGSEVGGSEVGGWLENLILRYVREHGKEIGINLLRELVLPWAKAKAAETQNKFDDYGAKQLERILNDPEFLSLLEDIG